MGHFEAGTFCKLWSPSPSTRPTLHPPPLHRAAIVLVSGFLFNIFFCFWHFFYIVSLSADCILFYFFFLALSLRLSPVFEFVCCPSVSVSVSVVVSVSVWFLCLLNSIFFVMFFSCVAIFAHFLILLVSHLCHFIFSEHAYFYYLVSCFFSLLFAMA